MGRDFDSIGRLIESLQKRTQKKKSSANILLKSINEDSVRNVPVSLQRLLASSRTEPESEKKAELRKLSQTLDKLLRQKSGSRNISPSSLLLENRKSRDSQSRLVEHSSSLSDILGGRGRRVKEVSRSALIGQDTRVGDLVERLGPGRNIFIFIMEGSESPQFDF